MGYVNGMDIVKMQIFLLINVMSLYLNHHVQKLIE